MWRASALRMRALWARVPESVLHRAIGASLLAPSATILGLSRWLTPDPTGVGTHLQLGLGTCVVLTLTGYPCPMCGMTTTFALLADGELLRALGNQPFGVVLFCATLVAAALGALDLALGQGLWRRSLSWVEARETSVAVGILLAMAGGWVYKILLLKGIVPAVP